MKLNVKQLLFFGGLALACFLIILFRTPIQLQSSLNDLFPLQVEGKTFSKELIQKYTNVLNIVVESDSFDIAKEKSDILVKKLDNAGIQNITYQIPQNILEKSIDYLKTYQNSFLSINTRHLLLNSDTEKVREKAIQQIKTSWIPRIIPLHDDPFLLLSEYVQNIPQPNSLWSEKEGVLWQKKEGKNYILILIQLDQSNIYTLSEKIHLIQQISIPQNSTYKIHLSGAPIHTVQTFKATKGDIFWVSCLAALILLALAYVLFHHIPSVLMVTFNLMIGFIGGSLCLFLFSPHIHFLTFAFGTSLVGICIDYSFHRFCCQDKKLPPKLFKNILYSFLTTLSCFIPLLFSDLSLLRQIAIFTTGGLSSTFLWVIITPPSLSPKLKNLTFNPFKIPFKKSFFFCLLITCTIGLIQMRIDHSPENLYKPSKTLQKEEAFFHDLNGTVFDHLLLIHGKNLQSVLEKEEEIKETESFFSLSSLFPSLKRQKQNFELIENLYKKEIKKIQSELGIKKEPVMKQTPVIDEKTFRDQFNFLIKQFVIDTHEGMWVLIPIKKHLNINDKDAIVFTPSKYLPDILDTYAVKSYQILAISFGFLFLMLSFIYRKKAIQYLLPSLLGGIGTISLLSLCGQGITFSHLLSLFVVVGLSIDYTIFLFSSQQLNKSVLFSFLSSLIGFGLLSFIHFQMIAIMGQTIALGLFLSFLITLTIKKIN